VFVCSITDALPCPQCNDTGRLENMTNLVYWYGAYENPDGAYSFVPTSKLVDFDAGKTRVNKKIASLYQKGKLSSTDELLQKGILEMEEDLKLEPQHRTGNIGRDFLEVYEHRIPGDQEYVSQPITPVQSPAPVPKKKKMKRKLSNVESVGTDDFEKKEKKSSNIGKLPGRTKKFVDSSQPKKKKKKTINSMSNSDARVDTQTGVGASTSNDPLIVNGDQTQAGASEASKRLSAYEEYQLAIKEDGLLSNTDEDDVDAAEGSESEDEAADDSFLVDKESKPKQERRLKAQDPPKKKRKNSKFKKYKRPKGEKRKMPNDEKKRNEQRKKFKECEEKYTEIVRRWEKAIGNKDTDQIRKIYQQVLDVVHCFTAPFIEVYELSGLMKRSKRIVNDDKRKELLAKLKEQYETMKTEVPSGFSIERSLERSLAGPSKDTKVMSVKVESTSSLTEGDLLSTSEKKDDSKERPSAVVVKPKLEQPLSRPQVKSHPPKLDKKKKFSLGNLMRPSSNTPQKELSDSKASASTLGRALSPSNEKLPEWVSHVPDATADLTDEYRIFALEFLRQAAPHIPETKGINYVAIARNLEAVVHEWSFGDEAARKGDSCVNRRGKKNQTNGTRRTEDTRLDRYWNKIHGLVASISGKHRVGTIAGMIAKGQFNSPRALVKLSDESLHKSFLGQTLSNF
jgi:hypothetical protein